ncbi:surfactin synthase thioesterase subunit [Pseudonocardia eucalypti]|uniref:thioesterase n=1 Tax=Pseudonocardia eucalypti TaxID=648755 RepID=UPI00160C5AC9|nr:surfactin synthase thioesterase subunit [Pseudonocardia eucalypti]
MSENLVSVDSAGTWLWELRPRPPRAIATLVLLPHSGAMAQGYVRWAPWFSDDIHLVAAQYPGRGTRFLEEHATDISELANPLAAVLAGEPGPLFVFGHSLGGLVGFEICWQLEQMERGPGGFFPSAAPAAHYSHLLRQPSDEELVAGLLGRGGLDRVALEDPDLLGLILDACRSDWVMTASYKYSGARRLLRCPIVAFGGAQDSGVPAALLNGWPELTTGHGYVHVLEGGHFYFDGQMATFTTHLEREIRALVAQG